ncbi:MAG: alanine racemase [Caldilineaceae bacterium]
MIQTPTAAPLYRPTWLEIDLAALRNNVQLLRRHVGADRTLFAVVKANAYGHGATLIAPAALAAGADRLAVAAVNEAIELRQAGIDAPILVMGYTPGWQAEALLRYDLTAVLYDLEVARHFDAAARAQGQRIRVHVKVDTGMRRLGLFPADTPAFLTETAQLPGLDVEGLYTHFSTADDADKSHTQQQLAQLEALLGTLTAQDRRPRLVHSANLRPRSR